MLKECVKPLLAPSVLSFIPHSIVTISGISFFRFTNAFSASSIIVSAQGIYEVEFSYLGYKTIVISDIEVGDNEEVPVNVTLNPSSNQLEEVVLTVSAKKNNEAAVLAIQKGAITLLDGLSAQTIKKSGDGNVATAIKRIPGVSVQGGKFVYVRGLGDRYSKTLFE